MSNPSFTELEAAAGAIIRILKTMPEFSNSKIAVIGGLGLWKYLRRYRTTEVSFQEQTINQPEHSLKICLIKQDVAQLSMRDKTWWEAKLALN